AKGIIVIAAAGNVWPFVVYPARYPEVLCVAATNVDRVRWSRSAQGRPVAVCAPGENVHRATFENGQATVSPSSGTSYATAVVAGIAALWLSKHGRENLIRDYGAGNVSKLFRWVVMNRGVRRDDSWDTRNLGAGIIDAKMVLEAELPEPGTFALSFDVMPRSRFEEIADYFPEVPEEELRARLMAMLNTTEAQLESDLERYGNELKLHMAMDDSMRARMSGTPALSFDAPMMPMSRSLMAKMTG
ncbi:MAG: S8 family peptidase, partial [Thermoanaerobaculia bacterium]